jgi:hypothetical protein
MKKMIQHYLMPVFAMYVSCCFSTGCNGQAGKNQHTMSVASQTQQKTVAGKTPAYDLHGIIDPGIGNMVAFALKTPRGWTLQQSFTRIWNGSTPLPQIHLLLTSPDGNDHIEYLPSASYYYSDGPTARSLRQTATQMGMAQQNRPGEMAPVQPLQYLQHILLPQLKQRGLQLQVTNQQVLPNKQKSNNQVEATAYVDGIAGGKKVRVECVIGLTTSNLNGDVFYNWYAVGSISQSTTDMEKCYVFTKATQNSLAMNPAWEQRNSQLVRNGNIANDEIARRDAANIKDYHNFVRRKGQELADQRDESNRKNNEAFRDAMDNEGKFEGQDGKGYTLNNNYKYVYKGRDENFLFTNTPINASEIDWTELQRVETKNY